MAPRIFIAAVIFALSLALCGCGPDERPAVETAPAPRTNVGEPAYGDMMIRSMLGDATVLLPVLANDGSSGEISNLLYNGLVKYDRDINLVGDLAEGWDILDDNLKIRFRLRKGVKWHDGAPFTARDVVYTHKVYVDPKTPTAYATDFLRAKIRMVDDYTVEAEYEKPYAPALSSWGQAMLPSHLLEGKDIIESPLKRDPIGTGPFRFKEWKTHERITVDANPDYFDGRPYISRVLTRIIPDLATTFLELKAGRVDQMGLTPLQYSRQTETRWFTDNFAKYKYLSFAYTYMGYNLKDWKFESRSVRQALTIAINRESIIQGVLLGLGRVTETPYKPDTYWYNHNVRKYPYDPELAKAMLAEAGWRDTDDDGLLDKDGKPFEFTIITNQGNDLRKNAATIIQRDLRKVGIKVHIRVLEWAAFLKNFINKRKFEACLLGWGMGIDPNQIDIWDSRKSGEHELNFIGYANEEVDKLLELGVSTYDREERKKYYDRFQEIIAEDQPYTFLWIAYALPIINSRFHGIDPAPVGIGYNFEKWYVPAALQKYQITP